MGWESTRVSNGNGVRNGFDNGNAVSNGNGNGSDQLVNNCQPVINSWRTDSLWLQCNFETFKLSCKIISCNTDASVQKIHCALWAPISTSRLASWLDQCNIRLRRIIGRRLAMKHFLRVGSRACGILLI